MVHQWEPKFRAGQIIIYNNQPPREIASVVIDESRPMTGIYNFVGGSSGSIRFIDNGYKNFTQPATRVVGGRKRKTHRNSKIRKLNRRKSNRRR